MGGGTRCFGGWRSVLLQLLMFPKISLLSIADYLYMEDEKGEGLGKDIEQNPLNWK